MKNNLKNVEINQMLSQMAQCKELKQNIVFENIKLPLCLDPSSPRPLETTLLHSASLWNKYFLAALWSFW